MSPPRTRTGAKAKDAKGTARRLLSYFKKYRFQLILVFVLIIVSAATSAVSSIFLKFLIDDYILPLCQNSTQELWAKLVGILAVMGTVYLIGVLSTLFYNRKMSPIAQGILDDIRKEMFAHMQALPIRYFDSRSHGDIMSIYTNDADTLRELVARTVPQFINSVVSIIVIFVSMVVLNPLMTLVVIAFIVIMSVITKKAGKFSAKFFIRQQQCLGRANGYVEEMINGQKVVKVFNHEPILISEYEKLNSDLFDAGSKAHTLAHIIMPIMVCLGYMQYVCIAITGAALAINGIGSITIGGIVSFLQLSKNFNHPVNMLSQQVSAITQALAGAERIFEFLDEKHEDDEGPVTLVRVKYENSELVETEERTHMWAWRRKNEDGSISYTRQQGDVRLEHVNFSYIPEKQVLYDVNVYAEPGQKVAFVGATGAGKTTITNLINRFYDIQDGRILYDGINILEMNKKNLRRSLGIVLQDVNLFTGTVMENIRYGRLDATDEECIEAARLANADGFIRMLPDGYNTMLEGDGSGLSQGQRQLLAIARCAVADPPAMILDEATSSIDTRTEALVQAGMDSLMEGRTVFVIAHRLSTVQNADVIMVLENGRIIERGNHEKLIAEGGKYYQLYTGAFELE